MQHHGAQRYNPELYNPRRTLGNECGPSSPDGRFGRLFALGGELQPHPSPIYDLRRLGRQNGPMLDDQGAVNDSATPAGFTFLAQFIDHDITLDTSSKLDRPAVPRAVENSRTPNLDLDCVYGAGPEASPFLFDLPKLRVGQPIGGERFDLARFDGIALIGDPRNDENVIVSQLQAAFIAFHNALADRLLAARGVALNALSEQAKRELFEAARDHVIHYYHRLLIEDFLPHIIGVERTIDIARRGRRFYFKDGFYDGANDDVRRPFMPVEFSVAAYRFGHSQVRQTYDLNAARLGVELFAADGLMGFRPIAETDRVDWHRFFAVDGRGAPQMARKIDPLLPGHLFHLDEVNVVPPGDLGSLAARNLNRGRTFRLPSGQAIARAMGETPLAADETVREHLAIEETPLWYYVLQEASQVVVTAEGYLPKVKSMGHGREMGSAAGNVLGPVGGTIVGEVITGLIDHYRERTGKGLDFIPEIDLETTDTGQFGQRFLMQNMLSAASLT
ncbi:MAG: peroxidase family protein [Geminicoccaceae bacterium]